MRTVHPQVWEILATLKENGIPFTILGNPFHLTDEVCRKLKFYGCEKYQLSIDGNRETHDYMRKPGSFDTTLEKIEVLHRNGIRVAIMTTVSGVNADQMPEIIDTVVKHEVDVFAFAQWIITANTKSSRNAATASCCVSAGAVPPWRTATRTISMRRTRNAGKQLRVESE